MCLIIASTSLYFSLFVLQFPIEGTAPVARHSHTASSYRGGAVVFGGLNESGAPLGDVVLLKPNGLGFTWITLEVQPFPVSRSVKIGWLCFSDNNPLIRTAL